jgi:hypothetical protein
MGNCVPRNTDKERLEKAQKSIADLTAAFIKCKNGLEIASANFGKFAFEIMKNKTENGKIAEIETREIKNPIEDALDNVTMIVFFSLAILWLCAKLGGYF